MKEEELLLKKKKSDFVEDKTEVLVVGVRKRERVLKNFKRY